MTNLTQYMQHFSSHRNVTVELIKHIQKEQYDYKPSEVSMSTHDLIVHILQSYYRFAKLAKTKDQQVMREKIEDTETDLGKLADMYTEKTKEYLESLTEEDLTQVIDATQVFGMHIPVAALLQMAIDHEIHHKGNLYVYLRGMGYTDKVPMFVQLPR
ncbi:DinB family protein [Peribacillus simplex]|uniref:DinB family protein n=1 Tax=Peribacillus simplex TaxID=1478 RepID=UPI0011DC9385|nr:DinB family protein [Peribacillus simplex]MED3985996.1 DinB family protein [Peribacillus simplex]MED4094388.1 DinB family protein [Peribacillus simplex]CAH0290638.1 hypothetical protein SRABI84_04195 [Peribacillus simplex]